MSATRRFTAIITHESDGYVSLCPELDIASEGRSVEEARVNLREALELFFESASQAEVDGLQNRHVFITQVEVRMKKKCWIDGLSPEEREKRLLAAAHHVVHDYANLFSAAELALRPSVSDAKCLVAPINTHVYHAFLLNCRKMDDFFSGRVSRQDDVVAAHYLSGFLHELPVCGEWRDAVNKQLTHLTMGRVDKPREITAAAKLAMRDELVAAWKSFLGSLDEPLASKFDKEIKNKLREKGFERLDLF